MTKKEIIEEISIETAINKKETEIIINKLLERIQINISFGRSVKFVGFGSFIKSRRKAKIGSDPITKRRTLFKAKGWPKFVPSRQLKKAVE